MKKRTNPATGLGLWDICDGCIVTTRGALWGAAELYGVDPTAQTKESWQHIALGLYSSTPRLPDGTFLQIVCDFRRADPNAFATASQTDADTSVFTYQRKRRQEFLASKKMPSKTTYIFWSSRRRQDVNEFSAVGPATHKALAGEVAGLENELRGLLGRAGFELRRLEDVEIFRLFAQWMAPEGDPCKGWLDQIAPPQLVACEPALAPLSPREQLFVGDVSYNRAFFKIGESLIKVLACKRLPDHTELDHLAKSPGKDEPSKLNTCKFPFRLVVNLMVPPKKVAEAVFRQQRRFANAFASKTSGPVDTEASEGLAAMNALDRELVAGARLIKIGLQVAVSAATERELGRRTGYLREALRDIDCEMYEESGAHDGEFFKTLPGMAGTFDRWRMVTSFVAGDFMPVSEYSAGDRNAQLFFQNALGGTPFGWSVRERVRANDNFKILGASGAGKSVLCNMLLSSMFLDGPYKGRVLAVDYAGPTKSSLKVGAEIFGGKYVSISGDGAKINPWKPKAAAWGADRVKPVVMSLLTQVTNTLLYNTGSTKEEALYESIIQQGIEEVYRNWESDAAPVYSDLLNAFNLFVGKPDIDQARLKKLIDLLRKMLNSAESKILNSRSHIETSGDFVVYDLFGLTDYDDRIRTAVAAVTINLVRELAFDGRPEIYKYVILEEVTNLLMLGLEKMAVELATTSRAHNTALMLITQEYDDFRRSGIAGSFNLNTTSTFLMSHQNAVNAMEPIIEDMQLNDREAALFRSLQAIKGKYSELLLKTKCWSPDGGRDVTAKLRFELSPFDMQLVASDPQTRAKQIALQQSQPTAPRAAILDFLAHHNRGQP